MAGEHDRAADQKEQVFEEDVVDHVQHAARVTQGAARGHGQHHVAQLAHRGVDEHELDATGAQGLQRRHDDGNAAYPHDHGADGALRKAGKQPGQGKAAAQQHEELDQAEDGALQQHGGNVAGNGRGREGRVHLPVNAEGQLRRLEHKTRCQQGHAQSNGERRQVGHVARKQAGVERRGRAQHAEAYEQKARAEDVEAEVFEGLAQRGFVPFVGDGQVERPGAHNFPEQEEAQ